MLKNSITLFLMLVVLSNAVIGADNRVKRAQFTTAVSAREPVDNIRKISTSYKTLTFFTEIINCEDCDISHQWWFQGEMRHEQEGEAKYNRYRWWSKKRVSANNPGTWTVKVLIDGDEVHTSSLNYFTQSVRQKNAAPINNRLQIQSLDQCESKLKYFHSKSKENPDDPYYAFMFRKWGKRCFESE